MTPQANQRPRTAGTATDTAPVRPGEELDTGALRRHLAEAAPTTVPAAATGIEVEQFPSGHSNLTYLVRTPADGAQYVLRRAPLGPIAPRAHDMAREFDVLRRLAPCYPPVPLPLHLCEDPSVIGSAFYLMERRHGTVVRDRVPADYQLLPDIGRRLSITLVDTLVDLHAVDVTTTGLLAMGRPDGFLDRQVEGWARRWERARTADVPAIDQLLAWLRTHRPEPLRPAVVHNDFKLDNLMLDPADPKRVVAVLDWEMTTVGDPLVDLGLSLVYWQHPNTAEDQQPAIGAAGDALAQWFTREQFLARYARRSGRDLSHVDWYEALGFLKLTVITQQIYRRWVDGQTADERFARMDTRVAHLADASLSRLT
ncbi:phosphotransferase family protein [Streptomyces sp. NPDC001928]|uniref:phosphotransferase family protein n=1 Tax=Streptomyces sp. NPDC001928 TaxID=3154404 RepID=UPI0033262597